jgi:hypothetical protein
MSCKQLTRTVSHRRCSNACFAAAYLKVLYVKLRTNCPSSGVMPYCSGSAADACCLLPCSDKAETGAEGLVSSIAALLLLHFVNRYHAAEIAACNDE